MRVIVNPSVELWDEVASRSEYATFFHTSTWAQIITQTYPHLHIATKGFMLDDGAVAIVPMVGTTERNRCFVWYESMFPGVYGGAVAERSLTPAEISYVFQHLATVRTSRIYVAGNPYTDQCLPDSYSRCPEHTHTLSLAEGFDAVFMNCKKGRRNRSRKARKMGVEVAVAETEEEFRSYHEVYEDSLRRWGDRVLITFPYRLFEQIHHLCSESARLWVGRVDGEIVSGNLVFYHSRHAVAWHGATREDYLSYSPISLLDVEAIRDACQRGFSYYDFNPSGGLKGVEDYKASFGAQLMHFDNYTWNGNRMYQIYHKVRGLMPGPLVKAIRNADQRESQVG